LCKLRTQITFDSNGTASLKLRGPEAKIFSQLHKRSDRDSMPLRKRFLRGQSLPLRFQEYVLRTPPPDWLRTYLRSGGRIKPGAIPVSQRQVYVPHKAQIGIQKHLDRCLIYRILQPFQSPWNSLPVQKPGTDDFRPVQELYAVNSATVTLHTVVPKMYMLLGLILAG
jgi:hypothetical protein